MAKLLLVEDDNNLREIYEARLSAEGYEISTAQNGEEALSIAKQLRPDLIISDVMMPRISGFEMLDILRNTDELKNTKVIMLTALGQSEDRSRADNLGADKYLVKSQVTLEDIVQAAHELLEGEEEVSEPVAVPEPIAPVAAVPEPVAEPEPLTAPEPVAEPAPAPEVVSAPADFVVPAPVEVTPEPVAAVPVPEPVPTPMQAVQVVEPPIVPAEPTQPVIQTTQITQAPAEPTTVTPVAPVEPVTPAYDAAVGGSSDDNSASIAVPTTDSEDLVLPQAAAPVMPSADPIATPPVAAVTPIPVSEQPLTPEQAANDAVLEAAINNLTTEPVPAAVPAPAPGTLAPAPSATPINPSEPTGRKVISPITDPAQGPDINALLAQEEAHEANQATTPAPTTFAPSPPAPSTTPQAPMNGIDPNSIAL